jgi:amidase
MKNTRTNAFLQVCQGQAIAIPFSSAFNRISVDIFHASEFPEQGDLIKARDNDDKEDNIAALKKGLRSVARQMLDRVFDREGVNIIAAPADSSLCIHAAASGYPIATVPLGQLRYNGRPFGLCMVARENREDVLLQFMAAYEATSPPRAVPSL